MELQRHFLPALSLALAAWLTACGDSEPISASDAGTVPDGSSSSTIDASGSTILVIDEYAFSTADGATDSRLFACPTETFVGVRGRLDWRFEGDQVLATFHPEFPIRSHRVTEYSGSLQADGTAVLTAPDEARISRVAYAVEGTRDEALVLESFELSFERELARVVSSVGRFGATVECRNGGSPNEYLASGQVSTARDDEGPQAQPVRIFAPSMFAPPIERGRKGEIAPLSPTEPAPIVLSEPATAQSLRNASAADASGSAISVELQGLEVVSSVSPEDGIFVPVDLRPLSDFEDDDLVWRLDITPVDGWTTDGSVTVTLPGATDPAGNVTDLIEIDFQVTSGTERVQWTPASVPASLTDCSGADCVGFEVDPCGIVGGVLTPIPPTTDTSVELRLWRVKEQDEGVSPSVRVWSSADPDRNQPLTGPDVDGWYDVEVPLERDGTVVRVEGVHGACYGAIRPFFPETVYVRFP